MSKDETQSKAETAKLINTIQHDQNEEIKKMEEALAEPKVEPQIVEDH